MINLLGPTVERRKHKATEFRLRISFPNFEPKVCANNTSLSCFIQQCVYNRFACRSECGNSNPLLRAEMLVVHCQDDDSTPLINRTFRRHQDWPLFFHFVNYPLLNETRRNNRRSLSLYSGGMRHLEIIPLAGQNRKTFCSKLFKKFPELTCNSGKIKLR